MFLLLYNGANANSLDAHGLTALYYLVTQQRHLNLQYMDIIRLLLLFKADPLTKVGFFSWLLYVMCMFMSMLYCKYLLALIIFSIDDNYNNKQLKAEIKKQFSLSPPIIYQKQTIKYKI